MLDSLDCFVMLSGYESELYDALLDSSKWRKLQIFYKRYLLVVFGVGGSKYC